MQAESPEEIEEVRGMKVKVPVADEDGNIHTHEVSLVSPELRSMVDNMLFMSAYGHKSMFESNRTRQAFRAAYAAYSLKVAIDKVDEFYSSWKDYRRRHPVERAANAAGAADGEVDLGALMGGDSDDEVPLFGARPPAAAEAPAGAAGPAAEAAEEVAAAAEAE